MLIVAVSSSGNYIGKLTLGPYQTKAACEAVVLDKKYNWRYDKVCVSMDHYTGKSVDKNVALD